MSSRTSSTVRENFGLAVRVMREHKLRSGLVVLGVTIGVAAFWILLCMFAVWHFGRETSILNPDLGTTAPAGADAAAPPATEKDVPNETPASPPKD